MKLFRLEDQNKSGPYRKDNLERLTADQLEELERMWNHHNGWNGTYPSIWCDVLDYDFNMAEYHKCACVSLEALKVWFEGYYDFLLTIGYELVEMDVPANQIFFTRSGKQVAFIDPREVQ